MSSDSLSRRAHWSAGQPISYLMRLALERPTLISLAAGFVDQGSLPHAATRAAAEALLHEPADAHAALQYGTTHGFPPLRARLRDRLWTMDRCPDKEVALDRVVVTAGSNELLHLIGDTLLNPGDIVLAAAPTYFVFLGMLTNLGARCIGVASDEHGMIPEALDKALQALEARGERSRVKAVYLTSYFDNPSSISLSAERRRPIVDLIKWWSEQQKFYIIEDTAYRELRYQGDDIPSLWAADDSGDTVIYTGTFSKSFSPGIRVGWGVLPHDLVEPVLNQKGNIDFGAPNFAQHLVHKVLELGLYEPHVDQLRTVYREKLAAMLDAAETYLRPIPGVRWERPSGGLYVWLELPPSIDTGTDGRLFRRALDAGVIYVPGRYSYPNEGAEPANNRIRLSFGVQSPENIRRGVQLLSEAIRAELS